MGAMGAMRCDAIVVHSVAVTYQATAGRGYDNECGVCGLGLAGAAEIFICDLGEAVIRSTVTRRCCRQYI